MNLVTKAYLFAQKAHENQVRKYTNRPYFIHPLSVACTVSKVTDESRILAAALLHDVVEDTPVTLHQIGSTFGPEVELLVENLTDVSIPSDGNRKARRAVDLRHTAKACPEAKTIKLADRIDNLTSIIQYDPDFATVYLRETSDLLIVLKGGDYALWTQLNRIVQTHSH
jgi:(p)ppGpp synthase/HD superfamily hydrolase